MSLELVDIFSTMEATQLWHFIQCIPLYIWEIKYNSTYCKGNICNDRISITKIYNIQLMTLFSHVCRVLSDCQRLPNSCDDYSFYHKYFLYIDCYCPLFPKCKEEYIVQTCLSLVFSIVELFLNSKDITNAILN